MKLNLKQFKMLKTKKYLKTTSFFFFFCGANTNSASWIRSEQEIFNRNYHYYKLFNKISIKIFKNSIFQNFNPVISSITIVLQPITKKDIFFTKKLVSNIKELVCLALKFNKQIYILNQIETLNYSFDYKEHKLILYQFCNITLKTKFLKISK